MRAAANELDPMVDSLLEAACSGVAPGPVPGDGSGIASRVARHASAVRQAGGSAVDALDSALVAMLFAGEALALAAPESGPDGDPARVRPVAARMLSYPAEIRRRATGVEAAGVVNGRRNLQLMSTRRCQLRCSYCPVLKRDSDMPPEVMEGAVDLLVCSSRDDVRLDFTGGEPLLRKDDVLRTADRLIDRASAAGKRAGFYMVTNGFLLNRSVAADLARRGFSVELSMDGPEEMHNRHKILAPGGGSENPYRATARAIRCALEAGLPFTVVMVASPDNVSSLRSSFEHVIRLGARTVDINYAVGRRWSGEGSRAFVSALAGIIRDHEAEIRSGGMVLGNLSSKVEPSILNAEWMVDTDGSLHLMTEWALESSRDPGAPARTARNVRDDTLRWDDLYAGRFHAYHSLLESYSWRSAAMRTLIHDNVGMGRTVSKSLAEVTV